MKTITPRIQQTLDKMGNITDTQGNFHYWSAAWQDTYNQRVLMAQIESCGDYRHNKTIICITRCKSSEPLITVLGMLYEVPQETIKAIAADILAAFNH